MDLYNLVVSAKLQKGGGGGDVEVDALNVTENGIYSASSGHAFDPVTVSVPQSGITPTGTKDINANGIYDVTNFASASVAVPTGVFPSGTSQIASNGIYDVTNYASASVNIPGPSGTSSITANGIYDITSFASVDVNVSGGGGGITVDEVATRKISGAVSGSAKAIQYYAFYYCSLITSADFPNATAVKSYAFANCSSLIAVSFPSATEIETGAFTNCTALTTASFPSVTSIGSSAFVYCSALTSVSFPNVTHMAGSAFAYCSALTTASFPNATNITNKAFANCQKLSALYLTGSSMVVLGNAATAVFSNTPITNSTYIGAFGSIFVPASLVETYKANTSWAYVSDRITAYEGE